MEASDLYGLTRDEMMRLRGIMSELLRQQFTQQHRITPTSVGDLLRSLNEIGAAIKRYDAKPVGRPKAGGTDE